MPHHEVDTLPGSGPRPYLLAQTELEYRRLRAQAALIGPFTGRMLRSAGLSEGMKVLDVGSGAGDVSLAVAEIVGPDGLVVGVDRNPEVLAYAEARSAPGRHAPIRFLAGDIDTVKPGDGFDAVVGRLVLMYLPDAGRTLRRLAERAAPGAILAFQELDFAFFCHSVPQVPLLAWMSDLARQVFAATGNDPDFGFKLRALLEAVGVRDPQAQFDAMIGGGPDWAGYSYGADVMRSLLPALERTGIATAQEVDVDTLADRLREQSVAVGATASTVSLVSAWGRLQ